MPVKCQNISFQTFIFPDIGFPMFETTLNWSNFINYCFGENCNMPWCYEKYQRMLKVALNCENILQLLAHIMIVLVGNRYRETSVTIRRRIFLSFPRTWNTEKRISIRIRGCNMLKKSCTQMFVNLRIALGLKGDKKRKSSCPEGHLPEMLVH